MKPDLTIRRLTRKEGRFCPAVLLVTLVAGFASSSGDFVYLGPERDLLDLFLHDGALVEESEGLKISFTIPEKSSQNPVLVRDREFEIGLLNYTCVLQDRDERVYKMWYQMISSSEEGVRRSACHYAVSKDGVNWEKPLLGLVDFEGSRENNILFVETENVGGTPSYWVIKDYAEPDPGRRYKMMRHSWDFQGRAAQMGWSPDGIRWTFSEYGNLPGSIDSQNIFFWDNRVGQYAGYFRSHVGGLRSIARATSADAFHWSRMETVHSPDVLDPPSWHLYTPGIWKLGMARSVYIMVTTGFDEESLTAYGQLGVSRDGIRWHRFREQFLPLGESGTWDHGSIYTIPVEASIGGRTAIFYRGSSVRAHSSEPGDRGVGVAFLQEGAFVGRRAGSEGQLSTRPFRVSDDQGHFYLLVDASNGSVRAELLDARNSVLEGFSRADSNPITGVGTREIRWGGDRRLADLLRSGPVRLKLYLERATVFGIRVQRPPRSTR